MRMFGMVIATLRSVMFTDEEEKDREPSEPRPEQREKSDESDYNLPFTD